MKKGKLVVIDGLDGSGKGTQTQLLVKRLRKTGRKIFVVDFPRYGKSSAYFVEQYLNEKYGTAKDLGPYIPSHFYALDRFEASFEMKKKLKQGYIVISNRYVSASMGHQGGKITNAKARRKYFRWLSEMEFGILGIPKPDLTIILHMPSRLAQKLVDRKGHREYVKGKKRDLHEKDLGHLKAAEKTYLEMAKFFKYPLIKSFEQEKLKTPTKISQEVWLVVKDVLD